MTSGLFTNRSINTNISHINNKTELCKNMGKIQISYIT